MLHKCCSRPVPFWNRPFLLLLAGMLSMQAKAQFGFALGPYFITPNFGTVCYGQEHDKIGNNQSVGGFLHLNFGRRFTVNISHLELASDRWGTATPSPIGYGVGARPVYQYLPLKNSEISAAYFFHIKELSGRMDFWGGDKLAKAFGLRAGAISSQRLVQIKPTRVNYERVENGNTVQAYDYVSWYDVTGLKQQMGFAGLEIDKYKSVEQYRNPFNRYDPQQRKRMYQQYVDVLYGLSQQYANYGVDSFRFSGSSIPNIIPFGWRVGLRRVTYNHLAHSFVCEFGQYPGQRRIPDSSADGIDVDRNVWKNWFVFVGFHLDIGHWFGDYE